MSRSTLNSNSANIRFTNSLNSTLLLLNDVSKTPQIFNSQNKLKDSNFKNDYQILIQTIPYGLQEIDRNYKIVFANENLFKLYDLKKENVIGKSILGLNLESDTELHLFKKHLDSMFTGQMLPMPAQRYILTSKGKRYIQENWNFKRDTSGNIIGLIAVVTDVTEKKKTEEQLQNIADFFSEGTFPVLRINLDGTLNYANESAKKVLLESQPDTEKQSSIPQELVDTAKQVIKAKQKRTVEKQYGKKHFSLLFVPNNTGKYANIYGTDITLRKKAEQQILNFNQELEVRVRERTQKLTEAHKLLKKQMEERKGLEKEVIKISEREKRLIGQELHDSICQQLAGMNFMARILEKKLSKKELSGEAEQALEISKLLEDTMEQARGLAKGLHPVQLHSGNIITALKDLCKNISHLFSIRCKCRHNRFPIIRNNEKAIHIYRITQEAITNAIKHGNSRNITVELNCLQNSSELKIIADGLDFPEEIKNSSGMGLKLISHRAEMINADLHIGRGTTGGSLVHCCFPNTEITFPEIQPTDPTAPTSKL